MSDLADLLIFNHISFIHFRNMAIWKNLGRQKWKLRTNTLRTASVCFCIDPESVKNGFDHALPKHTNLLDQVCQNID